jgi:hypothetical protein
VLVPHSDEVYIEDYELFDDFVAIEERSGGLLRLRTLGKDGKSEFVASDEPAYAMSLSVNAEPDTPWLRYTYSSLTTPNTTYEVNVASEERKLLKRDPVLGGYDPANYVTERVWAIARDGTKIPVSVVYRKGFRKDGTAPMLQYAYGSYGLSMDPSFSVSNVSLLDRGVVYALAHIRGGQEMGRAWYDDGHLLNKQNSFNDFIDVTRYLVKEGYAAPGRVAARGGSAGGLLMGGIANMAPKDYKVIIAQVPFVDVVTTMLDESIPLTTNEFDEWGNPKDRSTTTTCCRTRPTTTSRSRTIRRCSSAPGYGIRRCSTTSRASGWRACARTRPTPTRWSIASTWKPATAASPAASRSTARRPSTTPSCWSSWASRPSAAGAARQRACSSQARSFEAAFFEQLRARHVPPRRHGQLRQQAFDVAHRGAQLRVGAVALVLGAAHFAEYVVARALQFRLGGHPLLLQADALGLHLGVVGQQAIALAVDRLAFLADLRGPVVEAVDLVHVALGRGQGLHRGGLVALALDVGLVRGLALLEGGKVVAVLLVDLLERGLRALVVRVRALDLLGRPAASPLTRRTRTVDRLDVAQTSRGSARNWPAPGAAALRVHALVRGSVRTPWEVVTCCAAAGASPAPARATARAGSGQLAHGISCSRRGPGGARAGGHARC